MHSVDSLDIVLQYTVHTHKYNRVSSMLVLLSDHTLAESCTSLAVVMLSTEYACTAAVHVRCCTTTVVLHKLFCAFFDVVCIYISYTRECMQQYASVKHHYYKSSLMTAYNSCKPYTWCVHNKRWCLVQRSLLI
jgi:hypothetical protein